MAKSPRVPVNPQVLGWARESAGYDIDTVAKRLQSKPDRVRSWETGEGMPTLGQLRKIADLLKRPPAFFLLSELPESDLPSSPDYRTPSTGFQVDASVELRREMRLAVEHRTLFLQLDGGEEFIGLQLPRRRPVETATLARDLLGVSLDEQFRSRDAYSAFSLWVSAVETLGVLVFQSSAFSPEEARGASIFFPQLPIVLLNGKDAIVGRSFSLFHELFHLIRGGGSLCDFNGQSRIEAQCNRFAAEVLMPSDALRDQLGEEDPVLAVARLARLFKVSEVAVAIQLLRLRRLDQDDVDRIQQETSRRLLERQDETSPIVPFFRRRLRDLGRKYVGAVFDAYYADRITLTDVTQYLGTKVPQVRQIEVALHRAPRSP